MFTWCDKLQRFSGITFLQRLIAGKFSIRKIILLHTSLVYLATNILLFVATTISNVFIVYNFVKYVSYFLLFWKYVWLQTKLFVIYAPCVNRTLTIVYLLFITLFVSEFVLFRTACIHQYLFTWQKEKF